MSDSDNPKAPPYKESMLPKPAELITLPSYMDC
ncbi:AraC family transcriptional regulator, partial [Vibrio sp. 1865]|nr:AraC family transcriptional regulator [Vibrio sp. 1865]